MIEYATFGVRDIFARAITAAANPDAAALAVVNIARQLKVSRAMVLASMNVGESLILRGVRNQNMGYIRQSARSLLKDEHAAWSARTTTKGLRVTRTA